MYYLKRSDPSSCLPAYLPLTQDFASLFFSFLFLPSYILDCIAAKKKVELKNTYFLGYSEERRGAIGPSLDPFDIRHG